MSFNVNFPSFGAGKPSGPGQPRQANPLFASPGDSVHFSGAKGGSESDPIVEINSVADFYRVINTFPNPAREDGLARERTAEDVKIDGNIAEALVNFLATDEGKKVCMTKEEFGRGRYKLSVDGTDVSFILAYQYQNTDKEKSPEIPVLSIYNKQIAPFPVYATQNQITDDYTTSGGHGPLTEQAEKTAELFEQIVLMRD